jgi:branched-chain amino acid transport system ATP-binding protein
MTGALATADLSSGYGKVPVLRQVEMSVAAGEIVGVLGANGAGKSTLLRTVAGALKASSGTVSWEGAEITGRPSWWRARHGIAHVPEGRQLFSALTVEENLAVAGQRNDHAGETQQRVFELFPRLAERRGQRAGTMSGGEQQMLAIGRAMMTDPRLLLVDELSAGLAPIIAGQLVEALGAMRALGMTLLVVEQSPYLIADLVDRCYVLQKGQVVAVGTLQALGGPDAIARHYLGDEEVV